MRIPLVLGPKSRRVVAAFAIVDAGDAKRLRRFTWRLFRGSAKRYAYRREPKTDRTIFMHAAIVGGRADHRNGNGLDNRRSNLRPATHSQNMQNRKKHRHATASPERGIGWDASSNAWRARVILDGRCVFQKRSTDHDSLIPLIRAARRRFLPFATN